MDARNYLQAAVGCQTEEPDPQLLTNPHSSVPWDWAPVAWNPVCLLFFQGRMAQDEESLFLRQNFREQQTVKVS